MNDIDRVAVVDSSQQLVDVFSHSFGLKIDVCKLYSYLQSVSALFQNFKKGPIDKFKY